MIATNAKKLIGISLAPVVQDPQIARLKVNMNYYKKIEKLGWLFNRDPQSIPKVEVTHLPTALEDRLIRLARNHFYSRAKPAQKMADFKAVKAIYDPTP
jgi:hypothetical protein